MRVLIVGNDESAFADFKSVLQGSDTVDEVVDTLNPQKALEWIGDGAVDTVVVDERLAGSTGAAFVEELIKVNPMVNTALVGSRNHKDFHEETEGLGVLMQLSPVPTKAEATLLLDKLALVAGLMCSDEGES